MSSSKASVAHALLRAASALKPTLVCLAVLDGLEIHALAIDRNGQLYAATDPDGKVYKVSPGAKPQLFYDPHAKYIWALAFDSQGNLFVATGDKGEIHRVTPDAKGSIF